MDGPTAIVAEDERVLRDELCQQLAQLWPELRIVGQAATGMEALQLLERHAPTVMLLDIEMPGLTGLEVAQQAQGRCHIVFVTAYDRFALAAFETGAVDYVLKPLRPARLAAAVARLRQRVSDVPPRLESLLRALAQRGAQREYLRWIKASQGQELRVITVDQVCYFQAEAKYIKVATASGDALIRRPLKELQEQLEPSQFWTIHRSTIVNASAIAGVARDFRGRVMLRLRERPEKLIVSEVHEHLFRAM